MARALVLAGLLVALHTTSVSAEESTPTDAIPDAASVHPDVDSSVLAVAERRGLDPEQLQGAVNATHMEAEDYLCRVGEGPCPDPPVAYVAEAQSWYPATVRLTYYNEYGRTASGAMTAPGTTACSYNFAFGTRFQFPDGEVFVCDDRGQLGSSGWLDLWRAPATARKYGPYVTVQVLK